MAFTSFFQTTLPALGLDISDRSLKMVELTKQKKGLVLAGVSSVEIEKDAVERGIIKDPEKVADALKIAFQKNQGKPFTTKNVVASLPEEQAFVRLIQLPELSLEEIDQAVRFEAEANIPVSIEEVYYDWQIASKTKKHIDILFAAVKRNIVDQYLESFKLANFSPIALEIELMALSRAVLKPGISYAPLLLVDFGATRTGLAIISGSQVRLTTTLPIAGSSLTSVLSQQKNISFEQAEQQKRKFGIGLGKEGRENLVALEPIFSELVARIKDYISFFQTHPFHEHGVYTLVIERGKERPGVFSEFQGVLHKPVLVSRPSTEIKIGRVILSGGEANLPGVLQYLAQALSLPVEMADPFVNLSGQAGFELPEREKQPLAVAIGLALRQFV